MTPCPSIVPKHNILVTWRALGPQRGGLGLQPAPTRKQESPGAPPFQALAGGSSWDWGPLPPHPLSWAGPPPHPSLPCPQAGPARPSYSCSTGLCGRLLVSGTPGGTPGSRDYVLVWGCGGRGRAGVQGRKFLARRAKDRVVPYPRSHPCARPPHPALPPGQPAAFPSPPVALRCSELHGPPHPGQPGRSMNGESLTNAKKTVGAPSASPGRPLFPQDRPPAVSAWSANTGPAAGRAPRPGP